MPTITITKVSYNLFKCWGIINLILGFVGITIACIKLIAVAAILGAVGIVSGGILITVSKSPIRKVRRVQVPIAE